MKIDDLRANGAGRMEVTGIGFAESTCTSKDSVKNGLKTTTEFSDRQPCGIKIPEIFCSDQDAANASALGKVQR